MNEKKLLDTLYEIKVSRTIKERQINYIKFLLNNFQTKQKTITILNNFVNWENLTELYLTEEHNYKGKQYLVEKLLTKDKKNFRRNKNVVFCDLSLATILKYYNKIRFFFKGYANISNGYYDIYCPVYEIIIFVREIDFFYQIEYFHLNGKDYEIDKENILYNNKYQREDKKLYIVERIDL